MYVMLMNDEAQGSGPVQDSALANAVGELLGLGPSHDVGSLGLGVWPISVAQEDLIRQRLRDPDAADARDREAARPWYDPDPEVR